MKNNTFSRENTLIFKGIGILLIVLHNFFHWIKPLTGENEWDFGIDRVVNLQKYLVEQPLEFVNLFFSYFGHFGVQMFIFISGAGLAISMQNRSRNWGVFMIERLKKLYPLLIIGFIFLFFYNILLSYKLFGWFEWRECLYKFLFLHTFNITKGSAMSLVGPWWFFGLIFQLYVLFPLLFKIIKKYDIKAFIAICVLSYMWIYVSQYLYQPEANILLFQNAPGHLPEFALGILLAMKKDRRIHIVWVLLSFVIFALGNFYKLFFPFTFLSVTVIFYWVFFKFLPVLNKTKKIKKVLTYYGAISMILFVIHGPLRWNFIVISGETFWGKILGAILLLVVATALSILGNMLHEWMVRRLDSTYFKKKPNCK